MTRAYGARGSAAPTDSDTTHYHIKFRFAGSTADIITGGGSGIWPVFVNGEDKVQYLYDSSSLGTKGTIAKIAFRMENDVATTATYTNYKVVLGHTLNTALSSTFASNMDDAQVVFTGTISIPPTKAGDWIEIPLQTPFSYDPAKNLTVQTSSLGGTAENDVRAETDPARYTFHIYAAGGSGTSTAATANITSPMEADLRLWIY